MDAEVDDGFHVSDAFLFAHIISSGVINLHAYDLSDDK